MFREKKKQVDTPYRPLPAYVTGPVPNTEIWRAVLEAGQGPVESNQSGVMAALLKGNPAVYRFI